MDRSFWLPQLWHPVLWLWRIWPFCPGLPPQNSSIRNTMQSWKISFKTSIHPQLEGQITLLLWSQTKETLQQITVQLHSHCNKINSFRRHTSCSSSSHHSSSHHPLADGCSHYPSCHDDDRHSHTPSHTHYLSCRHHSHHSLDHAAQDSQPRKIKQCPRPSTPHKLHHPKTITIQDSPSDSPSDSDSDSDPLNY